MRLTRAGLMLLGCLLVGAVVVPRAAAETPPNIIFLIVDDMGWGDPSYTPNVVHDVPTPNIDALTARGMRFTNATTQVHCSPSRASIQTGRHSARGSVNITSWISHVPQGGNKLDEWEGMALPDYNLHLPQSERTVAQLLGAHDYLTAHVGKWHLGEIRRGHGPGEYGYDELIGSRGAAAPGSYLAPFPIQSLDDVPDGASLPHVLTERTIDFIRSAQNSEQPFFISFEHFSVHTPLEAPESTIEQFRDEQRTENEVVYHAMIHELDEAVGTLTDYLQANDLFENTFIMFYSEDGGVEAWADNGGLRGGKKTLWEGGVRVPAAFIWEGRIEPGTTSDALISDVDLVPTALDAAGVPAPADLEFDGISLWPVLDQQHALDRDTLVWHHPRVTFGGSWMGEQGTQVPASSIRQGDYKLYHFYQPDLEPMLFDLQADPGEQENIAEQRPELVDRMRRQMLEYLIDIDAEFPEPNNVAQFLESE